MLQYDPKLHILRQVIREVEVEYSVRYLNNTIHIELDVPSILAQLSNRLTTLASAYKEETGSSHYNSVNFAEAVKQADLCIHFGPHSITAEPSYEVRQCVVDNGYKLKEH